jgi:predicted Zn-dependent peptidase
MSASYEKTKISDTIGFHAIIDPKFKSNTIKVRFLLPLDPQRAAAYALASSLLTTSCREYPSIAALNRKMNRLYGASACADVSKMGDFQAITLTFSAMSNRYALQQEDILGELLHILNACIFDPNLEHDGFSATEYAIKVKDLLDTIDADINNKRGYALRQCARITYQGEAAAFSSYGTKEDVLALTPQRTYAAYQELLRSAVVEIFFVGPQPQPSILPALTRAFARCDRTAKPLGTCVAPSPCKAQPVTHTEALPVAQCKMVLAFKSSCDDAYAMHLMNLLYGQTPFSKLFANVREKLSLCYYCTSTYNDLKQTLFVDCGVEKEKLETAKEEILKQLSAVAQGDFDDTLLEHTRLSAYNSIRSVGDTPSSYVKWYFAGLVHGPLKTTEETIAIYQSITRQQIMDAAASLTLDAVYIMEATGEEDAANG